MTENAGYQIHGRNDEEAETSPRKSTDETPKKTSQVSRRNRFHALVITVRNGFIRRRTFVRHRIFVRDCVNVRHLFSRDHVFRIDLSRQ